MNVRKIAYFASRLTQLGFGGTLTWGITKGYRQYFVMRYKKKAQELRANHSWKDVSAYFNYDDSFDHAFTLLSSNKIFERMLETDHFVKHFQPALANDPVLFEHADALCKKELEVLGGPRITFERDIPWHFDNKLPPEQWGTEYWNQPRNCFYQDIHIDASSCQLHAESRNYYADIKVPWELSRMQHIFTLGRAFQRAMASNDHDRVKLYSETFVAHVESWLTNNPYLLGVNWVCPMEVAIRAVNIMWGFHLFKSNPEIPRAFWEKVVCSLYDHLNYLEYNRETSDKPNNHYIADLVGLLYMGLFFKALDRKFERRQARVLSAIWEQVDQQIQADGTSYEGSTCYHRLVTEMFVHVGFICQLQGVPIPPTFFATLSTMKAFLQDCTDLSGALVQIGDNDSGRFVTGLRITPNTQPRIISYKYAGLTIINANGWHMTYRHPTFSPRQPTGHFHADELSITFSLDGRPLLVDPGAYLYTGSVYWRNYFRSAHAHNTFFIPAFEKEPEHLFVSSRMEHGNSATVSIEGRVVTICNKHMRYSDRGLEAYRKCVFDSYKEILEVHDWWQAIEGSESAINLPSVPNCVWNFHWAPDVSLYQSEPHAWIISRKNKPIAHLTSTLSFTSCPDFVSAGYGMREPAVTLTANHPLSLQRRSIKIHRF